MKPTAQTNNRWKILVPLLLVAAWLAWFGDKTPVSNPETRVVKPTATQASNSRVQAKAQPSRPDAAQSATTSLEPLVPRDLLIPGGSVKSAAAAKASRDLFEAVSWTPPPVRITVAPPPAPPPVAPPLPFTYIGKQWDGKNWQVFLTRAEHTLLVTVGSTVDNLYRVDSVVPPTLQLTYLPLGQTQSISIGDAQ